jgi:hypothetical protein
VREHGKVPPHAFCPEYSSARSACPLLQCAGLASRTAGLRSERDGLQAQCNALELQAAQAVAAAEAAAGAAARKQQLLQKQHQVAGGQGGRMAAAAAVSSSSSTSSMPPSSTLPLPRQHQLPYTTGPEPVPTLGKRLRPEEEAHAPYAAGVRSTGPGASKGGGSAGGPPHIAPVGGGSAAPVAVAPTNLHPSPHNGGALAAGGGAGPLAASLAGVKGLRGLPAPRPQQASTMPSAPASSATAVTHHHAGGYHAQQQQPRPPPPQQPPRPQLAYAAAPAAPHWADDGDDFSDLL